MTTKKHSISQTEGQLEVLEAIVHNDRPRIFYKQVVFNFYMLTTHLDIFLKMKILIQQAMGGTWDSALLWNPTGACSVGLQTSCWVTWLKIIAELPKSQKAIKRIM